MSIDCIGQETEPALRWLELVQALEEGHLRPRAEVSDSFLYRGQDTVLSRSAWIDGLGIAVKTATIFPGNRDCPSINGGVALYADQDGRLEALLDFHLVTRWKTAGDSLLAARRLARKDASRITLVGAGQVADSMVQAYTAGFPGARFRVWNRNPERARRFAEAHPAVTVAASLEEAVRWADIICTCTMATDPVVSGRWLQPGQHLDLIGAYRPDMREVDDEALLRARIFVDSRETTLGHIGELRIPLETGVIGPGDVQADFYGIASGAFARRSDSEITLAKNGGGAHLDLMTARYILQRWRQGSPT